ncbi:MAG: helix-turn-helix transcriptional regulator [Methylotenera sp.]
MNIFGDRLREERERFKMSQEAFAEMAGVHRKSQANYELGDRLPDAKYLSTIATFGADVIYLLLGNHFENTAVTSYELAFLRNCRSFKDNKSREMALNALVAMSGYKPATQDASGFDIKADANKESILEVAEPKKTKGDKK